MAKGQYHINNDNRRLPCSAEFKCEFASNAPHFNTPREADDWLEMEALSRSVYDTMVQEFGKENLDPKMMASMGVTEWTLHARDPERITRTLATLRSYCQRLWVRLMLW